MDLPEDVITVLSVQAAKEGKSAKAFMEGLLISAANDLEDIKLIRFFPRINLKGMSWLVKPNKKPLNRNMVYHECRIFKAILKAVDKLSGKVLSSVLDMIREVKNANGIDEITNARNSLPINQYIGFV
ncbi:hypothetical protein [Bacteroides fragilis]|uniref:hypothetical protein n=1 Tax=Bacteroides fragilis TaxID=817 RepID=UPI0020B8FFD4|nr:hypothetical protein [Bacteroides fragilis]